MRYRTLRYGMFVVGLLLAAVSFLVCLGNSMMLEGRKDSIDRFSILGMIGGSTLAGIGIIMGAVMSRRFVCVAVVIMGGLVGAAGGWSLASLMTLNSEWILAVCLFPIGMWLGFLGGVSGSRAVVGSAVGGTVGALLAALAFPILFNMEGPPINNGFWALSGLLIGGFLGTLIGAFIGSLMQPTTTLPRSTYWRPFRLAALLSVFSLFALTTAKLFLLFLLFLLPIPAKPRTQP
jgi:hypothetical protein